jgi:hypothetical protein
MADHVDGPRTMADPSIDLTDVFAFTSPENPDRTVVVLNVFPGAGESSWFSNAAYYSLVLKKVKIESRGRDSNFKSFGDEVRFQFKFNRLLRNENGGKPSQTGVCSIPGGMTLPVVVGDEQGSSSLNGKVRIFAGLRSDPFFVGWFNMPTLQGGSNFTQNDNILSLVVDFDTQSFLSSENGSLFGVIGESTPVDTTPTLNSIPRFDWAGRPELANYLITIPGEVNLLDLWNQQTPFDVDPAVIPLFRERLLKHFRIWDMKDGKRDWSDDDLNANVNIFLNDFILIDTSKPTTDTSHLEIEKSLINGNPHKTGGGRTLDANSVDILVTWMINRDHGPFLQSQVKQATQISKKTFPYLASPNTNLLIIEKSISVRTSPESLWDFVGDFDKPWTPLVVETKTTNTGLQKIRTMTLVDGKVIVELLIERDPQRKLLRYQLISGIAAQPLISEIRIQSAGPDSVLTWKIEYIPDGQGNLFVDLMLNTWVEVGLAEINRKFKRDTQS